MANTRKGEKQKQKMLYLAKIFCEETDDNHYLTMPQIIQKLAAYGVNADRKTLYQDFEELKDFGMDILTSQDGRSYYYYLGSRDFELPELKLLVDSVQSSKFITDKKSGQLIKKLVTKGLVEQIRNEDNKRVYNLKLTSDGERVYKDHIEFNKMCQKITFDMLNEFSDEELMIHTKIQRMINQSYANDVSRSKEYYGEE